ncbi:MAG: YbaB/EbfC family nucleoid-associated protein [Erysipelotrichaceae bacterium]|nr:YbaB/EbfC family nucleoid-associated protein [Erysipelotrichaceae bacterium]
MNFNNLLQQAQQMQRKVNKAKKSFDEQTFDIKSQGNIITGVMKGNLEIIDLHIDKDKFNRDNQDDIEALLMITINQMITKINKEKEDTLNKITNGVDVSAFL